MSSSIREVRPKWHLSFDCATKTLAFSLSYIDFEAYKKSKNRINSSIKAIQEIFNRIVSFPPESTKTIIVSEKLIADITIAVKKLDLETRNFIKIIDGDTVDLFPDKKDDDTHTVERIQALARYVTTRIRPILIQKIPAGEHFRIIIEYQGINLKTHKISSALIALFADNDIVIVGPTLKNKVFTCEEGKYCYFAERYSNSYYANKIHTKFNFAKLEDAFGTDIAIINPVSLRGHIADSFMQVIGYIIYGADEKNIAQMF